MALYQFNKETKIWEQHSIKEFEGRDKPDDMIYLDNNLKKKLDFAKELQKKEWDVCLCLDGIEGCGKSTLSFILGWYMSNASLTMDNIAEGCQDAAQKLAQLPDESLLIIDEGSLSFASTDVMSSEHKRLTKILNVIRQKRMILIIVAPSFFNLSKYIAAERSRFLLHCYTKKGQRGFFEYFGEKRKRTLYMVGKKNYNSYDYPRSNFKGRFSKFDPFGDEYRELKKRSLLRAIEGDKKESKKDIRGELIQEFKQTNPKATYEQIAKLFNVSYKTVQNRLTENKIKF